MNDPCAKLKYSASWVLRRVVVSVPEMVFNSQNLLDSIVNLLVAQVDVHKQLTLQALGAIQQLYEQGTNFNKLHMLTKFNEKAIYLCLNAMMLQGPTDPIILL